MHGLSNVGKMKLLHYVGIFSISSETFIYDLICNLENEGLDNYVLSHKRELENERPFSKIKITSEHTSFVRKVYFRLCRPWTIRNQKEVLQYIQDLQPDLIHAHFGYHGVKIYNLLKQYRINIPLIVSFHGADITIYPRRWLYRRVLYKMNLDDRVAFTAPSEFLKNKIAQVIKSNINKIDRIYCACNDRFNQVSKRVFWQYGKPLNLLNVSRFSEEKGQVYLIKAFRKVVDFYPNSRLTLIGYGCLEDKLRQWVKRLKLSDSVVFMRQVEHKKLPDLMPNYDIYLQPSIVGNGGGQETLSVSTIEAQTVGLPAIVSRIGGLKEVVVHEQSGFLIPANSADAIFDRIRYYIQNEAVLRDHSLQAPKNADVKFNRRLIVQQWMALYADIKKHNRIGDEE